MNNNKCESPAGGLSFENNSVDSFGFTRTFVYIDGFNLYHAVNKFQNKSWLSKRQDLWILELIFDIARINT